MINGFIIKLAKRTNKRCSPFPLPRVTASFSFAKNQEHLGLIRYRTFQMDSTIGERWERKDGCGWWARERKEEREWERERWRAGGTLVRWLLEVDGNGKCRLGYLVVALHGCSTWWRSKEEGRKKKRGYGAQDCMVRGKKVNVGDMGHLSPGPSQFGPKS